MSAHEERLVLELHAKWGNRWSRIARKLPGRTDNEIKNYWRTHMRKKAQKQKKTQSPSQEVSESSSNPTLESISSDTDTGKSIFYDTGEIDAEVSLDGNKQAWEIVVSGYPMEDIWKTIDMTCESPISYHVFSEGSSFFCPPPESPVWDYCSGSLWKMNDEENAIFPPPADHFPPYYVPSEAPSNGK